MNELTKVEEQVMNIIWKLGRGFVKDFIAEMPEPKPPYNTISSVVRILERKGFVDHKAYGKTHEYFPIISKDAYRKFASGNLLKKYFSGSVSNFLSFFAEEEELDLKELSEIITQLKSNKKDKK